jgi:release factor glutamine methyltransferase
MHIHQALNQARDLGLDRLDAQLLLAHVLQQPRAWLLAHDDAPLSAKHTTMLQALMTRRAAGEPLAYVIGECEFRGLRLQVSPAVLIPRPETELLVEWALEHLPQQGTAQVVDLGCGSGAIALAIKHARPHAQVWASDLSTAALEIARSNAHRHQLQLQWQQGDWWAAWAQQRFDLALANPPYVAGADPHLAALGHEPRVALTPEGDGLSALQQIVHGAPRHLQPGAWLLLEHGHDQAINVQHMLQHTGFVAPQTRHDLAGLARCTGAKWPGQKQ